MKRIFSFLLLAIISINTFAQGWPANYSGVMLQGFYWDSYEQSNWNTLTAQADELSQFFDLIWVTNSGKTSDWHYNKHNTMGYDPCFWLDHNSCWGTESELRNMISTFKSKGTGIIEDVVINHKNGFGSWVYFPNENVVGTVTNKNYSLTWDNTNYTQICSDDEANTNTASGVKGKIKGNADTGDNFDGYRDLDHTNATTQANVNTYLDYLLNELGYAGFRYDMVKGFSASYVGQYNKQANPTFSVGEYWDGNKSKVVSWINGTKKNGVIQSAAFDFPMKYNINAAFNYGNWSDLDKECLANDNNYSRYSVSFVDNHDTGRYNDNGKAPVYGYVEAANAYILAMPGTPCVWMYHWMKHKGTIKKLILARKAAGITNQSNILKSEAQSNGFVLQVEGSNGNVLLLLGTTTGVSTNGYKLAVEGEGFKYYVSTSVDISAISSIADSPYTFTMPSFCTVNSGERCAFFEVPSAWNATNIYCWNWDKIANYTKSEWPGKQCTLVGTNNGNKVYKWTMDASDKHSANGSNAGIIFNAGNNKPQTGDMPFVNGGYYSIEGMLSTAFIPTGISHTETTSYPTNSATYNLSGQRVGKNYKGIVIRNGKKIMQ
jgi:alpha-amylase